MTSLVKRHLVCEIALPVAQLFLLKNNDRLRHDESFYDEVLALEVCSGPFRKGFEASPVGALVQNG
jgi:hypothetical protein